MFDLRRSCRTCGVIFLHCKCDMAERLLLNPMMVGMVGLLPIYTLSQFFRSCRGPQQNPSFDGASPYLVSQATLYSIAGLKAVYGQSVFTALLCFYQRLPAQSSKAFFYVANLHREAVWKPRFSAIGDVGVLYCVARSMCDAGREVRFSESCCGLTPTKDRVTLRYGGS